MDVIAVNQAGITNAVATLGTALTNEQAVLIKRYADEIVVCYDSDEAGQKATARAIPILRNAGLLVRVLTVPNGKDPDEFIKSKGVDGAAAFKDLLEKSGNDVDYRLQKLKQNFNLETSDGKVAYLEAAAKTVATISSPIERDVYSSKISNEFQIEKAAFVQQINSFEKRNRREFNKKEARRIRAELSGQNDKINTDRYKKPRSSSAEESLVVYLINNPDSAGYISKNIKSEQFQNSLMKRYYEYFLSREERGLPPLTSVTADFSGDEASKLYQMLSKHSSIASTRQALDEYINVINEESRKLSDDDIVSMSGEDINEYLKKLRDNKK